MFLLIYPSTSFFVVQVLFTGADSSTKSNTALYNHISWTGKTLWKLHSAINSQKHRSLEKTSRNYLLLCHQLPYSDEIKSTWSTNKFTCSMEGRSGLKYQEHMMMETGWRNSKEHTNKKNHTHVIIKHRRDNQLIFIRSQNFQLLSRCCWRLSHQWDSSKLKFNSLKTMKWSFPKKM